MADDDRLRRVLETRPIEVNINDAMERRLRLFVDRVNRQLEDDPIDPDQDDQLAFAILACIERGLDEDEADAGLASTTFGTTMSAEVMSEYRRRHDGRGPDALEGPGHG